MKVTREDENGGRKGGGGKEGGRTVPSLFLVKAVSSISRVSPRHWKRRKSSWLSAYIERRVTWGN